MIRFLPSATAAPECLDEGRFQRLKTELHAELVESFDLASVGNVASDWMKVEIVELTQAALKARRLALCDEDRRRLLEEMEWEVFGSGPIEPLLNDPTVSDILVNGPEEVYVERFGKLEDSGVRFADDRHLLRIVQRIVARVGRRIDEVSPMVDARLPDGSRVNAIVPPLSLDGPKLSIRRFGAKYLELSNLVASGAMSPNMAAFLKAVVQGRASVVISGGTGAGKTTLLDALSAYVPRDERIVTIEDSAELKLQHPHVVRLETRPGNTEGMGEVTARDLLKNALRMRPDRILVGEVRGGEALDMLQAMNTGHQGSLTTLHANDTRDALARLEMMVAMAGYELPVPVVRQYVACGIQFIVHLARLKGGVRRVVRVSELVGVRKNRYALREIFAFRSGGLDEQGASTGQYVASGYVPRRLDALRDNGAEIDLDWFDPLAVAPASAANESR